MTTTTSPGPTAQQRRAIDSQGVSIVLSSGAGCGKTAVLTDRYVHYLNLGETKVSEIVAITFTDRAAREMRRRIRQKLEGIARENPHDERWTRHLRSLESASIQTIHSFCSDLLRRFAVEAGIDPQFEVLEEVLAENLRVESLRDTLQKLLLDSNEAGQDLCELVVIYGWNSVTRLVRELMKERDVAGWTRALARTPAEIGADWAGPRRENLRKLWIEHVLATSPKITRLVQLFRTVQCLTREMRDNVAFVLENLPKLVTTNSLEKLIEDLTEAAKLGKGRTAKAAWPEDQYEAIKSAMADFRAELPKKLEILQVDVGDLSECARIGQRFLRVASAVVDAYQIRKRREGVVDFQDLLVLARDLVRDAAAVRTNLRERYRFLLLDEMQDTDPVQMELIELICGDGIPGERLFAVGDAKQSIYRFRGADVELFETLRKTIPSEGRLSLTRNFRSQAGVLNFVNALCGPQFDHYEPLEAHFPQKYPGASVEFLWSIPAEDAEKESATTIRTREADAIARHICKLRSDSAPRVYDSKSGELRAVQLGDIVLLFRSMSNVAIYEAALRRHGLNYYLVGGRAFFAQQEVYDLLNLLRALENPGDTIALAGVLRSPFGCLSDESLFLLAIHRAGLWIGLHDAETIATLPADQQPRAERIAGLLDEWRTVKDRLPIARLINRAVADTGYDAALQFESLGERKLANLWKLVDLARTFDAAGLFGLPEFIARLGEMVSSQPREEQAATQPEEADVIRIMSIHQSKGLEFPVVFVPDIAAATRGGDYDLVHWHRELGCVAKPPAEVEPLFSEFPDALLQKYEALADWKEDLRVLYVACTRARDLLILSGGLDEDLADDSTSPIKKANSWMVTLSERFDLKTGALLGPLNDCEPRPNVQVHLVRQVVRLSDAREMETEGMGVRPPVERIADVSISAWPREVLLAGRESSVQFDRSEWPDRLNAIAELHSAVEYVCAWPDPDRADERPLLRSVIDYLWEAEDGRHVLLLAGSDRISRARCLLSPWVVHSQFGEWPARLTVFDPENGKERLWNRFEPDRKTVARELESLLQPD